MTVPRVNDAGRLTGALEVAAKPEADLFSLVCDLGLALTDYRSESAGRSVPRECWWALGLQGWSGKGIQTHMVQIHKGGNVTYPTHGEKLETVATPEDRFLVGLVRSHLEIAQVGDGEGCETMSLWQGGGIGIGESS